MTWQEKAVAAALYKMHCAMAAWEKPDWRHMEAALRAALPLIEVTPAMRFAATGETRWAANPAEHADEILAVMLDRCAKERPQQ
jgi:hypothetical protein